jgi:Right handed beta helix region
MRFTRALMGFIVLALAVPAAASAYGNPSPPANPGNPSPRAGGSATLRVCKQRTCRYRTIQSAVNAARKGDTIRVANGTYREGVRVNGARRDKVRLIGNPRSPRRVFIDARRKQNGVLVNSADGVTIDGFRTKGYLANGFLVSNANGYTLNHLIAEGTGAYGLFAFNSLGGRMKNSEAYYNNDSGFYIGQTPPQRRPKRSIVDNVKAWGNVLGWSGTNMRYVTIRNSDWYNNGLGIVPNTLSSEKFPPPESNVISGNRVFWNNYNYYLGAPFPLRPTNVDGVPYPVGTGILLYGSQDTRVENNQIFGNFLVGFGEVPAVLFDKAQCTPTLACQGDPTVLEGNRVRNNRFGAGGADLNGRDMLYDGSGTGNCFEGNTTPSPNVPADNKTFVPCGQTPPQDSAALGEGLTWALEPDHEKYWIRRSHRPIRGITPLERYRR